MLTSCLRVPIDDHEDSAAEFRMSFEYKTVDIPVHNGRPAIDPTLNEMARDGWRPLTVIEPTEEYPSYSIVFERKLKDDSDTREGDPKP